MNIQNKVILIKAQPLGAYPHGKQVGPFIFVSGTSSRLPDNTHRGAALQSDGTYVLDITEQTRGVIENIQETLKHFGADLSHLVEVSTFLMSMEDFQGYNEVYSQYFSQETGPARTTVAVRELPHPNLLIEVKAIAYLDK